ncbi:MAG TPA: hypothetical protein VMW69_16035 [Spirochaetia bacterium]|nr:hypothetical protein [Spirochaetia bacterium]
MSSLSNPRRRLARRFFRAAGVAAALAFSLILGSCAGLPPSATVPRSGCRSDPLAGVYDPWRLHVIAPCVTVSGTVDYVKVEPDNDWHVNLKLDPGEPLLTNWVNRSRKNGDLVLEVIPMDQSRISAPTVGEHITVTGAYVLDLIHGWREIHPVWRLNDQGSAEFDPAAAKESVDAGLHRK